MKIITTDLYNYFKLNKPSGYSGATVTAYIADETVGDKYRKRPAIMVIPGGGYTHIGLREGEPIALAFLERGFNAFVFIYTCNEPYPVQQFEASLAEAYIKTEFTDYIENELAVIGFSAGAHLAACLGALPAEKAVADKLSEVAFFKNKKFEKYLRPDALILCYPVISSDEKVWHKGSFDVLTNGDNGLIAALSIEKRIDRSFPPTYVWHTANDDCVNVMNSIKLVEALAKNDVPFSYHVYGKGVHGLSLATPHLIKHKGELSADVTGWIDEAVAFLAEQKIAFK